MKHRYKDNLFISREVSIFLGFLEKEKVLTTYLYVYYQFGWMDFVAMPEHVAMRNYLLMSFNWSLAPGLEFWANINERWRKYCETEK